MIRNFCGKILSEGGTLVPLIVTDALTGLMNPSILVGNKVLVNVRHTNYALYHNERYQNYYSIYGPLVYMNPENDQHLKTDNVICHLNSDLSIRSQTKIDTSKFDHQVVYEAEFHGLEDGRLVKWKGKTYLCGVRRDTEATGIGRFELSEIIIDNEDYIHEIGRYRIEPPLPGSHCEKNWMPIADMPYHFVKWTNPLEVIKVDLKGTSETVILKHDVYPGIGDIRGGSQVITIGDYRVCAVHEVNLKNSLTGRKDAKYVHRFVIWDKEWNMTLTEPFSFLNGDIEFCCGIAVLNEDLLVTFGFQDNAAFLLRIPMASFVTYSGIDFNVKKKVVKLPVYYISSEKYKDRQKQVEAQLKGRDIHPVIITKEQDESIVAEGKYLDTLDKPTLYAVASHLRAVKKWVTEGNEPYALFVEDDVYMSTIKFPLEEFIDTLPKDWDCVQLTCVRENLSEVKLHLREWDDWSATAYLLKRDYAVKLVNQYYPEDVFHLEIGEIQPLVENILFLSGTCYTIPMFTENIKFKSTSHKVVLKEEYKPNHYESAVFTMKWWKENEYKHGS